jgi:hypothetical protein
MAGYQYFTIPFDLVPSDGSAPYTVWYATWSSKPPVVEPGMPLPLVIGATAGAIPSGATPLGTGTKNPPPPPPAPAAIGMSDYQASVSLWLQLSRDADE